MVVENPLFEDILIYAGKIACFASAIYFIKIGQTKIGVLLFVSFGLMIQSGYVVPHIDFDPESQGACWATGQSYYDCLPVLHRISMHAGQVGTIMLALAIFLAGRMIRSIRARHS